MRRNIKTKRLSDKLDYKKLGPFKIAEVKGPINYKLELLGTIKIYPVFYASLLKPALKETPIATDVQIKPINLEGIYDVEEILDY